jgi:hypothetical protein
MLNPPGGAVGDAEAALERQRREVVLVPGHELQGLKPQRQRHLLAVKQGPRAQSRLLAAVRALPGPAPVSKRPRVLTPTAERTSYGRVSKLCDTFLVGPADVGDGSGTAGQGPYGERQLRRAQPTLVALRSVGTRFSPSTRATPPSRRACGLSAAKGSSSPSVTALHHSSQRRLLLMLRRRVYAVFHQDVTLTIGTTDTPPADALQ